jgi:hypothetical protein
MTTDVTIPPASADPRAEAAFAVAAEHQASQAQVRASVVTAILAVWAAMNAKRLVASWTGGIGERIFVILSIGQETVAQEAAAYIETVLRAQDAIVDVPTLNPLNFAGISSDGRDLEDLLVGSVIRSLERLKHGDTPEAALKAGGDFLTMVAATQISDAGRAADQVALVSAEPREDKLEASVPDRTTPPSQKKFRYGWVRMLTPPSCSRCATLAGRFYKWNEGFERHPMCDCRHIPAIEAIASDLTTNPKEYFNSLSKEDQDKYFGVSSSRAIRDGADLNQVVNATKRRGAVFTADDGKRYTREGITRRGVAGRSMARRGKVLRPTPGQIYKDAKGRREEAIRLLREFGYLF